MTAPAAPPCPRCKGPTKLRSGSRGAFWSCASYPTCRGTIDASGAGGPVRQDPLPPPRMGVPPNAFPLPPGSISRSSLDLDPWQRAAADWRSGWAVVAAAAGCHPYWTKLLRADGSVVLAGEVREGERLMGMDGSPRTVLRCIRGEGSIYEVVPVKGQPFMVNANHILTLVGSKFRSIAGKVIDVAVKDVTTKILGNYKLFRVPVTAFYKAPCSLPLDPYFLGVLIGDGCLGAAAGSQVSVTKPDPEIEACCWENAARLGMEVDRTVNSSACPTYNFRMPGSYSRGRYEKTPIRILLEALGLFRKLSGERFIPSMYKTASFEERASLLAGILDTDGHYGNGMYDYVSQSEQLAMDVAFVARSLGLAAYVQPCQKACQTGAVGDYFRVGISGELSFLPLRIPRKQAKPRRQIKSVLRTGIKEIRYVGEGYYFGFTLDGDGHYLLDDFTVTHNSGKSTLLVERTAALLDEGEVPESLLLLVYNRSAADLLRQRLGQRVGPGAARLGIYTFHAWAFALLRCWYPGRFVPGKILGGSDGPHPAKVAIPLVESLKLDVEWGGGLKCAERVAELLRAPDASAVAEAMGWEVPEGGPDPALLQRTDPYVKFCLAFSEAKRKQGLIDFTDMLCEVASSVWYQPEQPHVSALRNMYRHVMVDEAQDANLPRMIISRWLGQGGSSLLVVGDLRQSISRYAGAKPSIFLDLANTPGVTLLPLPVNRRSAQRIVEAANEVADGQSWNLGGATLPREGAPPGEPLQVWESSTPAEESRDVVADIRRRVRDGLPLEVEGAPSYCVLARTNAMLVELEYAFVSQEVPVRVSGSPGGLLSTEAGSDLLTYLEGAEGIPTFGLVRVANRPKRYAKKADVGSVIEEAVAREKVGKPPETIASLRSAKSGGVARLGADLLRLSGLPWNARALQAARWLGLDDEDEVEGGEDRRAAIEALLHLVQRLGSLAAIYAYKREVAKGEKQPAVELSTIHAAKGREWPVVYVTGVRSGKLPHKRCTSPDDLEEERRLLYVAVTRARDACILSTGGSPSRFLADVGWLASMEPTP